MVGIVTNFENYLMTKCMYYMEIFGYTNEIVRIWQVLEGVKVGIVTKLKDI